MFNIKFRLASFFIRTLQTHPKCNSHSERMKIETSTKVYPAKCAQNHSLIFGSVKFCWWMRILWPVTVHLLPFQYNGFCGLHALIRRVKPHFVCCPQQVSTPKPMAALAMAKLQCCNRNGDWIKCPGETNALLNTVNSIVCKRVMNTKSWQSSFYEYHFFIFCLLNVTKSHLNC